MKKTVLEIYALAVCFVTVVCFVIAFGIALYSLVQIAKPEFTMSSWTYASFQTNDAYWDSCGGRYGCGPDEKKRERPPEPELTKKREEAYSRALASEQRDGGQSLVKSLIVVLLDLAIFFGHWVLARRARTGAA